MPTKPLWSMLPFLLAFLLALYHLAFAIIGSDEAAPNHLLWLIVLMLILDGLASCERKGTK